MKLKRIGARRLIELEEMRGIANEVIHYKPMEVIGDTKMNIMMQDVQKAILRLEKDHGIEIKVRIKGLKLDDTKRK